MSHTVIETNNINMVFDGLVVLEDINISINKGDYVGLIGPNGSGKSTLIKIILGLLKPTSGSVKLFNCELNKFSDWQKVSYVPQKKGSDLTEFPFTALEVITMEGVSKSVAIESLKKVGLADKANVAISKLSGGQQQRVFIARALVSNPELLILDEPTSGVDQDSQSDFYKLLSNLNKENKITLILVSHDIDVVAHEVTHLLCINKKLICHGKPHELLNEEFVKKVYGDELKMVVHGH